MNKALVLTGVGATFAVLLLSGGGKARSADEKVHGLPKTTRISYRYLKPGETSNRFAIGPAEVLLDGKPFDNKNLAQTKVVHKHFQDYWTLQRNALPKGADQVNTDTSSKELYWVPSWLTFRNFELKANDLVQGVNGVPVDEFGRTMPGNFGDGPQNLWDQTLGGLLENPLFKAVVVGALIASGPQGLAAYGAYTMWENRGQQLTLKNAALAAGRAYVVGQCGPACGVAFDFGVGVASGKSVDKAAESALLKEMTQQQRAAYTEGRNTVRRVMA